MKHALSKILNQISRIFSYLSNQLKNQEKLIIDSTKYDMFISPNEQYYAEQYWNIMLPHLKSLPTNAKILDLGCSQGRFTLPLAKQFPQGEIIACDFSEQAVDQAKKYTAHIRNINFQIQSIAKCLENCNKNTLDAIVMTEVTFFYPGWTNDFSRMIQVVKPDGLLFISFRPQYFNVLYSIRNKRLDAAKSILSSREGNLLDSQLIFTWQTSEEIKELTNQEGAKLLDMRGIGVCSGITGDPHDHISQPSNLNAHEKSQLMDIELELGKSLPDAGRYILAILKKQ